MEWLRGRGVVFEEYDVSGLRTVNDIAEVRDSEGNVCLVRAPGSETVRAISLESANR